MKELTERHHAYIAATFYRLLLEQFGKSGEQAFVMATQRYGEQRGSRMAQRAIRDGRVLDFLTYKEYGEWVNTSSIVKEMGGNQSEDISYAPYYQFKVTVCPWARQFEMFIRDRDDEGQCDDCPITRKEIRQIIDAFTSIFEGARHERILYPQDRLQAEKEKQKA